MTLTSILSGFKSKHASVRSAPFVSNLVIDAHLSEAKRLFQSADYQQALWHCEEALSQGSTNPRAYQLRGVIRHELQDPLGATEDLHRSLDLQQAGGMVF